MSLVQRFIQMLINHAVKYPYFHLDDYMHRYWLFGGSNRVRDYRGKYSEKYIAETRNPIFSSAAQRELDKAYDYKALGWRRTWLDSFIGFFIACRIHFILRSDHDRELHNHPCRYVSVILRGQYTEVTLDREGREQRRIRKAGSIRYYGLTHFHRLEVEPGDVVVTAFFMGRKLQPWGFFTYFRNHHTFNDYGVANNSGRIP